MITAKTFENTVLLAGINRAPYLLLLFICAPICNAIALYSIAFSYYLEIDDTIHTLAWSSIVINAFLGPWFRVSLKYLSPIINQSLEFSLQGLRYFFILGILNAAFPFSVPDFSNIGFQWVVSSSLLTFCVYALFLTILTLPRFRKKPMRVLMVGITDESIAWAKAISKNTFFCVEIIGYCEDRGKHRVSKLRGAPLLGEIDEVAELCEKWSIDRVMIGLPSSAQARVASVLEKLNNGVASAYVIQSNKKFDPVGMRIETFQGQSAVSVIESPAMRRSWMLKSVLDRTLSALLLILLFPVFTLVALFIKLDSKGPVFFKQKRYGIDGAAIDVWKFRSMTTEACNSDQVIQAQRIDRRVTTVGKFLRKSSIDELPQLINVLNGTMSLVGPRPHAVEHNEHYRTIINGYMLRHKVKPGMTGLAQVRGLRGETETVDKMEARIRSDLDYMRKWSFTGDLWLIIMTPVSIIFKNDVY